MLSKCLQALLICYFLMNSITVTNSFNHFISQNTELHSLKGITCHILKKIFECESLNEGVEEYETAKADKAGKGILSGEYLMPPNMCLAQKNVLVSRNNKVHINNSLFTFGFFAKIHLPPPEIV